jgi:hypothetical protein
MPKHAILVTYNDMEGEVLREFIAKAQKKYDANFSRLYFDSGALATDLTNKVRAVPADEKLKIYVSGHGGTGKDYIMNDAETKKQTIQDLGKLLASALKDRATSANTEVNMISCLFGRTPDGSSDTAPAVKLHRDLCTRGVYVDLVARTESIVCMDQGRQTLSPFSNTYVDDAHKGRGVMRKAQFSKIRCTFQGNTAIVQLRAYAAGDDVYIQADGQDGRRALWADYAVNEIMKSIHVKKTNGDIITGDVRERALKELLEKYDAIRTPIFLKTLLEKLVDGSGNTVETNFKTHRDFGEEKARQHFQGCSLIASQRSSLVRRYGPC